MSLRALCPYRFLVLAFCAVGLKADADVPAPSRLPVLRDFEDILNLSPEEADRSYPVDVEGVITLVRPGRGGITLQESRRGMYVFGMGALTPGAKEGNSVRLTGVTVRGSFAPSIAGSAIEPIRAGATARPIPARFEQLLSGEMDNMLVLLRGTVVFAKRDFLPKGASGKPTPLFLRLQTQGHLIPVGVLLPKGIDAEALVDAEVEVQGVCAPRFNRWRQRRGPHLLVGDASGLRVVRPVETSLDSMKLTPIGRILQHGSGGLAPKRIRVQGIVTLADPELGFYIQEGLHGVALEGVEHLEGEPGDFVEALGFPAVGAAGKVVLRDPQLRVIERQTLPESPSVHPAELLKGQNEAQLVRAQGELTDVVRMAGWDQIYLRSDGIAFSARVALVGDAIPPLEKGSRVELHGVCRVEWDEAGMRPLSFQLLSQTPSDITVVTRPPLASKIPWVTVVWGTLGFITLILCWVGLLRRQVWRQTTALKEKQKKLLTAMQEATAASAAKGDFLANMSHEIRTPMNAVLGMTKLALATELNADQRQLIEMSYSSARGLLVLLNDILDFSKIEAGKLALEEAEFDVIEVVERSAQMMAINAHRKGIEVVCDIDPAVPRWAIGDSTRLQQMLVNLLGNAVKFTAEGEVVVRARLERHESSGESATGWLFHFEVRDSGIGIAADKQDRIFGSFEQADNSVTRRYGGTGLGLAICARLTKLMQGRIWVESEEGLGSTFHIVCRLGQSTRDDTLAGFELPKALEDGLALIVDDNRSSCRAMIRMLAPPGIEAVTAHSLAEARTMEGNFALVIADSTIVPRDLAARRAFVREYQRDGQILILLFATNAGRSETDEWREAGARLLLLKPLGRKQFIEALATATGPASAPVPVRRDEELPPVPPMNVLLVEDNRTNQFLMRKLLDKGAHQTTVASNGREAVEFCASRRFDVILMDVQMPEMGGLEATARIRARESEVGLHTPIIALTAHAMAGDREMCLDAGMDDYLTKPVSERELAEKLALWCPAIVAA